MMKRGQVVVTRLKVVLQMRNRLLVKAAHPMHAHRDTTATLPYASSDATVLVPPSLLSGGGDLNLAFTARAIGGGYSIDNRSRTTAIWLTDGSQSWHLVVPQSRLQYPSPLPITVLIGERLDLVVTDQSRQD